MPPTALVNLSDAAAGWGTISYNGYTFPGLRNFKLSSREEYDKAGRVVMFTRYTLIIHFFVTDADLAAHETAMINLRARLSVPGQVLSMTDLGIGDLIINGPNATNRDVEWGPKPIGCEFTQVGGITTEVTWTCEFAIKFATSEGFSNGATPSPIAAFNFSVDWSFDDAAVCTRTISGFIKISQTRNNGGTTVGSSADTYRNRINVLIPAGMRRGPRRFSLSEDKNQLDFSITDIQLEAESPPVDCLNANLDYEIESIPPGFAKFMATLSGSIEVPVGVPSVRAAQAFVRVMIAKIAALKAATAKEGAVIPMRIRLGRTLGTRTSRFGAAWLVTGCLDDLLKNGGLWAPIPGETYQAWAQSMVAAGVWSNRGPLNLIYNTASDAIVDLGTSSQIPTYNDNGGSVPNEESGSHVFKVDVTEKNSWLAYENTIEAFRDSQDVVHQFSADVSEVVKQGEATGITDAGVEMTIDVVKSTKSVTQTQGAPIDYIIMRGKAMRISYKPTVPRLISIGTPPVPVVEMKVRTDGPKAIACFFGATVYTVRWAILYRLKDGYITKIPTMPNPALCCDDVAAPGVSIK